LTTAGPGNRRNQPDSFVVPKRMRLPRGVLVDLREVNLAWSGDIGLTSFGYLMSSVDE
jgi:hypothetical protein